jgi:hypothetical protein
VQGIGWLTDPDAFRTYPRRSIAIVAPSCGIIVAAVTYWGDRRVALSGVAGLITALLMAHRMRRFAQLGVTVPRRLWLRLVPLVLVTLAVLGFGVADGSFPEIAFGVAGTSFWFWIYRRAKNRRTPAVEPYADERNG